MKTALSKDWVRGEFIILNVNSDGFLAAEQTKGYINQNKNLGCRYSRRWRCWVIIDLPTGRSVCFRKLEYSNCKTPEQAEQFFVSAYEDKTNKYRETEEYKEYTKKFKRQKNESKI